MTKRLHGKIQVIHIWADEKTIGDADLIKLTLKKIVEAVSMTPHGEVMVQVYPLPELGFTAKVSIQSFDAMQHLYESYIIYDNWIELNYANLIINSCKDFDNNRVIAVIEKFLEPTKLRVEDPIRYDGIF